MIGYNVKEINDLLEKIKDSYKQIKDAMSNPWPELSKVMRAEWVGEDELANENTLSNALGDLYAACSEAVNGVIRNIRELGETWRTFQSKNTIEGGVAAGLGNIAMITEIALQSDTIELFKGKGSHISASENLGLKNGLQSATTIENAIDSYANDVYKAVEKLYHDLDDNAKKSFLGEDQSPKIIEYLHKMGSAIAKLTVCIKSVKQAINDAAKAYQQQAQSTADGIAAANTDINTDQAVVGGSN